MPQNHFEPISVTTTMTRQTPKQDFGAVLGQAVASGADLIAPIASVHPLLSAAVSGVKSVVQATPPGGVSAAGTSGWGTSGHGSSDPLSMIDANRQVMLEGAQLNQAYLSLQQDMQRESQQYSAISNIMKVRHDSAKAAINNIR